MRYPPDTLHTQLNKEFLPVYVVFGNDPYLVDESAQAIRAAFQKRELGEREAFTIEGSHSSSWEALHLAVHNRSLFSLSRLIDIRLIGSKIGAKESALLEAILATSDQNTFFLIQLGPLSQAQQQSKWFISADKKGAIIVHWPLNQAAFSRWVENRLKQMQLHLPRNTIQLLIYHTEGNCLAAAQEIERLALLKADQNDASLSFIDQYNQFTVFDLVEAALHQNANRVVQILQSLKTSGVAVPLIIWSLSQALRVFTQCEANPSDVKTVFQRAGIRSSLQPLYLKRLKVNPPPSDALLAHLFALDKMVKTGQEAQSWPELVAISLQLSGISNSIKID
jgi:DNA polymerase-3 subunit delta